MLQDDNYYWQKSICNTNLNLSQKLLQEWNISEYCNRRHRIQAKNQNFEKKMRRFNL
jgi:hypothetical protein